MFDLVAYRLKDEYLADCGYEPANVYTARWVYCDDEKKLAEFKRKHENNLAFDGGGYLTYLARTWRNSSGAKFGTPLNLMFSPSENASPI